MRRRDQIFLGMNCLWWLLSNLSLFGQVFLFRNYTAAEGLPDDFVFRIRQDSRGYMWFATSSGLGRYDGVHFQNYSIKNGLSDNAVRDLVEDEEGRIWVATASGLSCFEGGRFRNYSTADGLPIPFIQCLCKGRDGKLWIGTRGGGVCYFDGKKFHRLDEESGYSLKTIWDIRKDKQGNIWFCGQESGVFDLTAKKLSVFPRRKEFQRFPLIAHWRIVRGTFGWKPPVESTGMMVQNSEGYTMQRARLTLFPACSKIQRVRSGLPVMAAAW
jgi:ligand-binding sensor domain-containing protein